MAAHSQAVDHDNDNDNDLPMPTPTIPNRPLTSFKTLSFDIYETLIQWESSIVQHFSPLLIYLPDNSPYKNATTNPKARRELSNLFSKHEKFYQSKWPKTSYATILEQSYIETANDIFSDSEAKSFGPDSETIKTMAREFGQSVGTWPPFPDTISAMKRLSRYYRLVALSNVDGQSFSKTLSGPLDDSVHFWKILTAQDIGSYKPSHTNFEYLFKNLKGSTRTNDQDQDQDQEVGGGGGGDDDEQGTITTTTSTKVTSETVEEGKMSGFDNLLHVAQSLYHDHVPCKALGIPSVWINRSGSGTGRAEFVSLHEKGEVGYGWRFNTLAEFADEVDGQFG